MQQLFCYTCTFATLLFLFSKFCCYLQTLLRQSIHKKQFLTGPSNPQVFRTQRWKSTNTGNDHGDTPVYITFHVTQPPRHITCVFVAHHVIGSQPIKLHSLLPRYNKQVWSDHVSTNIRMLHMGVESKLCIYLLGPTVKSTKFKLLCFWSAEFGFESPAVTLVSWS